MAIICIVLGLWGIWDYVVAIPRAATESSRARLLVDVVQPAMVTELGSSERDGAIVTLNSIIEGDAGHDPRWISSVTLLRNALSSGGRELQIEARALLESELNAYGHVTPPSKFDRPMQWLFIVCLPFGFYYLWRYTKMKNKASLYYLDDDGRLTTPEGTWQAGDITDIDMERWIAKKGNARTTWTAKVIVNDGSQVLLDDYIYEDMHLIIGAIANRFYPEQWTPLARRVRTENVEEDELLDTHKTTEEG